MTKLKLSLVIPAYKEAELIALSLGKIYDYFEKNNLHDTAEVIVVTADSDDGTPKIVAKEIKRFKHQQHITPGPRVGKGRDVRAGVQAAKGEIIIFTDADLATPLKHIEPMMKALRGGADLAIGIRNLADIHDGFRYYVSNLSNLIIQLVLLPGVKDSQCGFKGFTRESAALIFDRLTILQWGFDMEVLKIAREHKLKLATIPIPDWADPKLEDSLTGDSPMLAVIKTFKELWQIRLLSWRGKYR